MKKKVLKKNFLECLWVRKVAGIGILRQAIVTQVIAKVVGIGLKRPATLTQIITEVVGVGQS